MVKAYLVARFTEVAPSYLARAGISTKGTTWYAPVFDDKARIFTNKASADAYAKKKNYELHNPPKRADGSFTIDISGYTDFKVIGVTKG